MLVNNHQIPGSRGSGAHVVYLGACSGDVTAPPGKVSYELGCLIGFRERQAKQPLVTLPVDHLEQIRLVTLPAGYQRVGDSQMLVQGQLELKWITPDFQVLAEVCIHGYQGLYWFNGRSSLVCIPRKGDAQQWPIRANVSPGRSG